MGELDRVRRLERELLDPRTRADPVRLATLLHPDFVEIGASGAVWDRDGVIAELAREPGDSPEVAELAAVEIAPGAALVTYLAHGTAPRSAASRRSSIWLRGHDGEWRVRFHQGTRTGG